MPGKSGSILHDGLRRERLPTIPRIPEMLTMSDIGLLAGTDGCSSENQCNEATLENQGFQRYGRAVKVMCEMVTLSQIVRDGSMVTPEERRELLAIARESIANALAQGRQAARRELDRQLRSRTWTGRLAVPSGAFVTIRQQGELRGCIGYIESPLPLALVVSEIAVKAATEDPRFVR